MITGGGEASGSAVVQAAPSPPVGQFHPGPSSQGVQVRTALLLAYSIEHKSRLVDAVCLSVLAECCLIGSRSNYQADQDTRGRD